jgi:hypothetical protein
MKDVVMRRIFGVFVLMAGIAGALTAANTGPQIQFIDGKLSVQADSVALSSLLRLIDQATGMTSRVPPALANRSISVRFSGLPVDSAIRKVFEGQPIDYVVIHGQGIVVTALSQARREQPGTPFPPSSPFQPMPETPFEPEELPPFQPQAPMPGGVQAPGVLPGGMVPGQMPPGVTPNGPFNQPQGGQPAMIQTPFGPIPNPRANQPQAPVPGVVTPGQNPFGAQTPFGTPMPLAVPGTAPNQNNNLFGNTSPPMLNMGPNAAPQQQRRP